jgi:hypothetical protein
MSFSMGSLLIHSEVVPASAREALKAAHRVRVGAAERSHMLESAARVLYVETGLDCRDVRELLDLPPEGCCS